MTPSTGTSEKNAIFFLISGSRECSPRAMITLGWIPDALLRRFRLLLPDRPHDGHEGRVDEQDVLLADLLSELADGFEEGHPLDVSDRPADLDEDDIGVLLLPHLAEQGLDLIRDVRDDLHGLPEVVAATFLLDHRAVDLPRGE